MRMICWISARVATGSSPPVLVRCSHTRVVTTGDVAQVRKPSRARVGWASRRSPTVTTRSERAGAHRRIEIPGASRVEYQFERRLPSSRGVEGGSSPLADDDGRWERFNDPANPRVARSPVGNSSVCFSEGYRVPDWAVFDPEARPGELVDDQVRGRRNPGFWAAVLTVLLPVVLMLARGIAEIVLPEGDAVRNALEVIGEPVVALLAGVFVAMWALGYRAGFDRKETSAVLGGALPPIAGILLIVAAGGGFKQVLVDAGVGNVIADAAQDAKSGDFDRFMG